MADHFGRGLRTACRANSPRFNVTEADQHTYWVITDTKRLLVGHH